MANYTAIIDAEGFILSLYPAGAVIDPAELAAAVELDANMLAPRRVDGAWVETASAEQLAAYAAELAAGIDGAEVAHRRRIIGEIDQYRSMEYIGKLFEAAGVANDADCPQIKGANKLILPAQFAVLGFDDAAEIASIAAQFGSMATALGTTAGLRRKYKALIVAETTKAGMDARAAEYEAAMLALS
jgi:hypothetical protein